MLKIVLPLIAINIVFLVHKLDAKPTKKTLQLKKTPTTSTQIAQSNEVVTDIEATADFTQLNNIANQYPNTTYLRIFPSTSATSFPALSTEATHQIAQLKSLKHLVIDIFPLSDSNLTILTPILGNLIELRFSGTALTNSGLQDIIGNVANITSLSIFGGSFSAETLSNVFMSIADLKKFNLANTAVTDAVIVSVLNKFTIEAIQLYGCSQITDTIVDGILALDANKLKAISSIELGNTGVTADGFARLKSKFPKLKCQSPFTLSK